MGVELSDGGLAGAGPADLVVEDEFTCPEILQGSLISLRRTVERIFLVTFVIGADDLSHSDNGQMWLKLRGLSSNVEAAKLFVKGVVNQEEQQELSYPGVLHCVFCGARGLFMDSLIKSTSAHIVIGSTGFLLISGLAEPVVRAYSLITELVNRYESTQSRRSEYGDRGSGDSLDLRRAFKTLVEKWDDRHTLDLLVLPWSVKEILLDLVKESGLGSSPAPAGAGSREDLEDARRVPNVTQSALPGLFSTSIEWTTESRKNSGADDPLFQSYLTNLGTRGNAEGAEKRQILPPQELEGEMDQGATAGATASGALRDAELDMQLPMGNNEFWLLLKFFTTMGYTEDVVKRVLTRTGPKEASQILDLVQQEQDRSEQEQRVPNEIKQHNEAAVGLDEREINRPCETEHREEYGGDLSMITNGKRAGEGGNSREFQGEGSTDVKEMSPGDDFVLGVLKKAAASCGYTEKNVTKFYNMLPDHSTHQLLLELQREETRKEDGGSDEGPREMDDVVLVKDKTISGLAEVEVKEEDKHLVQIECEEQRQDMIPDFTAPVAEPDLFMRKEPNQLPKLKPHQTKPEVKGPPMAMYTSSQDPEKPQAQNMYWLTSSVSKQSCQTHDSVPRPRSSNSSKQAFLSTSKRKGAMPTSSVVVTGEQRFLEGLLAPFQLKLTDDPGDPTLRTIIIDGSNVAMSHGLGHFFSCRGIALAVQHFWDRRHRHISALLPQWRQKSDPKIKEQHYLSELQKLGLLSYTPSREVQGKRISSYDDRLMLQLAERTNGVIVTNDNLRDLLDESRVFQDIIKKRLLQYTFVGDHFMVPDDPLGRGGPHLDDFLRSENRSPRPGSNSFASSACAFSPTPDALHLPSEGLNFDDQTPKETLNVPNTASRGKEREHGKGREGQITTVMDRKAEDTAALRELLCQVFPGQDNMVTLVLQCHPAETDINILSDLILEQQAD